LCDPALPDEPPLPVFSDAYLFLLPHHLNFVTVLACLGLPFTRIILYQFSHTQARKFPRLIVIRGGVLGRMSTMGSRVELGLIGLVSNKKQHSEITDDSVCLSIVPCVHHDSFSRFFHDAFAASVLQYSSWCQNATCSTLVSCPSRQVW
jgi:hypothetical protein